MADQIVHAEELKKFSIDVLVKAGLREADATILADSLVFGDLRGVSSHGVVRLATYLERIRAGVMNLDPQMRVECERPGSALLDGQNGFGQLAGMKAMTLAIDKAKVNGIGMVAVKNSNHFGVAAFYAMKALSSNMIGMICTNASPAIAPFNTRTPLMGTNPIVIAVPAAKQLPIVLDMATSVVARGKIRLYAAQNKKMPMDWAMDVDGKPTDDAKVALKGSLAPIGGPKGSGLSLIIDLLCGVLTGSSMTGEVKNITDASGPMKVGHFFIAINVSSFSDPEAFKQRVDEVIVHIKSLPSVNGGTIYLPGEIEFEFEAKRKAEGIPLTAHMMESLDEVAQIYGVPKLSSKVAS